MKQTRQDCRWRFVLNTAITKVLNHKLKNVLVAEESKGSTVYKDGVKKVILSDQGISFKQFKFFVRFYLRCLSRVMKIILQIENQIW